MKANLFNQEAMDQLSTPEKLNQQVKIIPPGIWVAFAAILVGAAAAILWFFLGTISSGEDYDGVIFDHNDVISINTAMDGIVQDVLVEEGDTVSENDIIALISNDEIEGKISDLRREQKKYQEDSEEYQSIQQQILDYSGKMVLHSKQDGIVQKLELVGKAVSAGDVVATIVPNDTYSYNEVYIYVPKEQAGAFEIGMAAQITPSYVTREEYGYMEGVISNISDNIVTENHILKHMGTMDFVEPLLTASNCVEVTIQLSINADGDGTYVWSNSKGEGLDIKSGDQCAVHILKEEYHPYELLLTN
jgi:multidrug resistance efflux pump